MGRALLEGDLESFEGLLGMLLRDAMSFHDFGKVPRERIYHAFLAGLLLHLEPDWRVRSNRESGFGRVDVTVESSLDAAHEQLEGRAYAAELVAAGAGPVYELAVVFDGKRVHVRSRG